MVTTLDKYAIFAAPPIAVTIATGVEMTSAHGHAITSNSSPLYNHSPHVPKENRGGMTMTNNAIQRR